MRLHLIPFSSAYPLDPDGSGSVRGHRTARYNRTGAGGSQAGLFNEAGVTGSVKNLALLDADVTGANAGAPTAEDKGSASFSYSTGSMATSGALSASPLTGRNQRGMRSRFNDDTERSTAPG